MEHGVGCLPSTSWNCRVCERLIIKKYIITGTCMHTQVHVIYCMWGSYTVGLHTQCTCSYIIIRYFVLITLDDNRLSFELRTGLNISLFLPIRTVIGLKDAFERLMDTSVTTSAIQNTALSANQTHL